LWVFVVQALCWSDEATYSLSNRIHQEVEGEIMSDVGNSATGNNQGAVSFERDIRPLFRESDRDSMSGHFDLWAYDDVVENSAAIDSRLKEGSMPCDGAWPAEQVETFERWVSGGFAA
jgi:hypothetical protein